MTTQLAGNEAGGNLWDVLSGMDERKKSERSVQQVDAWIIYTAKRIQSTSVSAEEKIGLLFGRQHSLVLT